MKVKIDFTATVFIFTLIYIFLGLVADLSFFEILTGFLFYLFFIFIPGACLTALMPLDRAESLLITPLLGVAAQFCFHIAAISSGIFVIYSLIFPIFFFVWFCLKKTFKQFFVSKFYGMDILAIAIGILLFGLFRYRMMDLGVHLPSFDGEVAKVPIDLAWGIGNSAAASEALFPKDFRIEGDLLRYHFVFFQIMGSCARTFGVELFQVVTKIFPILICFHLPLGLAVFVRRYLASNQIFFDVCFIFGVLLFSAYPGVKVGLNAGLDNPLNFVASQSATFGFTLTLGLFAMAYAFLSAKNKFLVWAGLFYLAGFTVVGVKVSLAAIFICGFAGTLFLFSILGWRQIKLSDLWVFSSILLGLASSYLYFFFQKSGGLGAQVEFIFPNKLITFLSGIFPFSWGEEFIPKIGTHLPEWIGAVFQGVTSFLIRYFALFFSVLIALRYKSKVDLRNPIYFMLFISGLAGITAGSLLPTAQDPGHFFHPGTYCLIFIFVSLVFQKAEVVNAKLKIFMCLLPLLSLPAILGDMHLPYFQGYTDQGHPLIQETDLDHNLLNAFRAIRDKADKDDVVLSGKTNLNDEVWSANSVYFFGSAFTERPQYLEGWGFSNYMRRNGPLPEKIQDRRKNIEKFYRAQSPAELATALLNMPEVRWFVWDTRTHGVLTAEAEGIFSAKYEFGPVRVFKR